MGKFVDISLAGDKEVIKNLKRLKITLQKKITRKALRAAAKPVLALAKTRVPRVTGERTDIIRKKLKIRALKRARGAIGVIIQAPTRIDLGIEATDRYYYPAAIELGTSDTSAQPFMRTSMKERNESSLKIVAAEVKKGIAETLRGVK